jgi:hypothetical protein
MYSTETEAKERWCPFVRFITNTDCSATNRWSNPKDEKITELNPDRCRCIASDCMMWRQVDHPGSKGYCGLAGKPV